MKLSKNKVKVLIRESIRSIIFEQYKGIIGGELYQDPESGEFVSDRPDEDSGEPIVFDSDEKNQLSAVFGSPELKKQVEINPELASQVGYIPKADTATQKKRAAKLFKGKRFTEQAKWMYGQRAFPGSKVYIIPIAGGKKEAAKLLFGYDEGFTREDMVYSRQSPETQKRVYHDRGIERKQMSQQDVDLYKRRIVNFNVRRHLLFDMSVEGIGMLTNLGVNLGEIGAGDDERDDKGKLVNMIDVDNDIVFIPLTTGQAPNFMSTPHMIIHALFDTTGEKSGTELDLIINPLQEEIRGIVNDAGIAGNDLTRLLFSEEEKEDFRDVFQKLFTTKVFRLSKPGKPKVFTSNDMTSEALTQEMTQQVPLGYVADKKHDEEKDYGKKSDLTHPIGFSLDKRQLKKLPEDLQSRMLSFLQKIKAAVPKVRELLKGKIVLINVF